MGDAQRQRSFASGAIRPGDEQDLNVRYVTDPVAREEMIAALATVDVAAIDIETGKDREGVLRQRRDAELVPVEPRFTDFEATLISGDIDPAGPMPRGELSELRRRQEKEMIVNARQGVAEIDARIGALAPDDITREELLAQRSRLKAIASRRYPDRRSYGLDPNEAVIRLIQIGIDHPEHGHTEFVLDAFRVDARPLIEALEALDIDLLVFYKQFEMRHLAARYGAELSMIDLRDGMLALCAEWERRGIPAPKSRSLASTFHHATGGELSKEQQVSNWNAPELSDEQIRYAAADVRILAPLYVWMREQMDELGVSPSSLDPVRTPQSIIDDVHAGIARKADESSHVTEWAARATSVDDVDKLEAWARTRRINYVNLPLIDEVIDQRRAELAPDHAVEAGGARAGIEI